MLEVIANGYGEKLIVTIDGEEEEEGMNAIVFAHPGMGAEHNNLEVNYSPTWATVLEEGIDTIIANAEISFDNDIIPYAARTIGSMTTSDALEVLGADNSLIEIAIEIFSLPPDADEPMGRLRFDELISLSRWGDTIGGIICTLGILKEAGIVVYSCSEAPTLLRQLQIGSKRMKSRCSQAQVQPLALQRKMGADNQAMHSTNITLLPTDTSSLLAGSAMTQCEDFCFSRVTLNPTITSNIHKLKELGLRMMDVAGIEIVEHGASEGPHHRESG